MSKKIFGCRLSTVILGVDHLTLSAQLVDHGIRHFQDIGFEARFVANRLPNHESKKPFLECYRPFHDISYLKPAEESPAVELVRHYPGFQTGSAESRLKVLFRGRCPGRILGPSEDPAVRHLLESVEETAGGGPVYLVHLEPFDTDIYWRTDSESAQQSHSFIAGFALQVENLDTAVGFWTGGLGFKVVKQSWNGQKPHWSILEFSSVVRSWSTKTALVEVETGSGHLPYLDSKGFTGVCFLTTNISHDVESLCQYPDTQAGQIFPMIVEGRHMLVCVIRGPNNELIEFIEVESLRKAKGMRA